MTTHSLPDAVLAVFGTAAPDFEDWLAHALAGQEARDRAMLSEHEHVATSRLDRFESVVGTARDDIGGVRIDANQLRVELDLTRQEVTELRKEVQGLRESVAGMSRELELRSTLSEIRGDLRDLGASIDRKTQWTTGVLSAFGVILTLLLAVQMLLQ